MQEVKALKKPEKPLESKFKFNIVSKVKHVLEKAKISMIATAIAEEIIKDFPEDVAKKEASKKSTIDIKDQISSEVGSNIDLLIKNGINRKKNGKVWEYFADKALAPATLTTPDNLDYSEVDERALRELSGSDYKLFKLILENPGVNLQQLSQLEGLKERRTREILHNLIDKQFISSSHKVWTKTTFTIKEDLSLLKKAGTPKLRVKELFLIKKERLAKEGINYTYTDLAQAMGVDNIVTAKTNGPKYMKDDYNPSFQTMVRLAQALDVQVSDLFYGTNTANLTPQSTVDSFKSEMTEGRMQDIGNRVPVDNNIIFCFGNPNTGKSYDYSSKNLNLKGENKVHYRYEKISVSGGIGNEFKGIQSSDLAISYDTANKKAQLGLFLQVLQSAIINPGIPHVIFLDDAHNQNLSSLLSEYTPVFKQGEKVSALEVKKALGEDFNPLSINTLALFNQAVQTIRKNVPHAGESKILNRISGEGNIELIFPDNFYLLVAGNYNRYTTQVFADWQDRALVKHVHSLDGNKSPLIKSHVKKVKFNRINEILKDVLTERKIFDHERYLFGIFKIDDQPDEELFQFVFAMIKNSLIEHGNSHKVNEIGNELIRRLLKLEKDPFIIYRDTRGHIKGTFDEAKGPEVRLSESNQEEVLHSFNIYRQED